MAGRDDEQLFEDEAARRIGAKVIEMADRVKGVVAAVPGAQAAWAFEMDDTRFRVVVTVEPGPATAAEAK